MNSINKIVIVCILFAIMSGCTSIPVSPEDRPVNWAQPIVSKHLNNFYKVDDNLYRSAQPDIDGILEAKSLGIKTIIDLQAAPHSDPMTTATQSMYYEFIPQQPWDMQDGNTIKFLQIVSEKENGPFLVHCLHGSDRTGCAVAMYRIVEQNWTPAESITEMKYGNYGFHFIFLNIPNYINDVDVEKMKNSIKK